MVYPTSHALAQNATDGSTTTERIERTDDTATMVGRVPDDTTRPVITVPENMVFEAPTEDGSQVRYYIIAQDDFDGSTRLGKDGLHVQDDVGGDIIICRDPASGSVFLIGDTQVECTADDSRHNTGVGFFMITVEDFGSTTGVSAPDPTPNPTLDRAPNLDPSTGLGSPGDGP